MRVYTLPTYISTYFVQHWNSTIDICGELCAHPLYIIVTLMEIRYLTKYVDIYRKIECMSCSSVLLLIMPWKRNSLDGNAARLLFYSVNIFIRLNPHIICVYHCLVSVLIVTEDNMFWRFVGKGMTRRHSKFIKLHFLINRGWNLSINLSGYSRLFSKVIKQSAADLSSYMLAVFEYLGS